MEECYENPYTKNGPPLECGNYRELLLLDIVYKILVTISVTNILIRLEAIMAPPIADHQARFSKGKS